MTEGNHGDDFGDDDEFQNEDNGSSSMDNSDFITINVTNEAGESKEIDHIKDKEHVHGHHTTHSHQAIGRGPNNGGTHSPAAHLSQPSTSGHSK